MTLTWRHYCGVALLTLLIFLPGRMSLVPLDRDEPRYMEASAQMIESGNFVDVRFLDQPRYLQPAGIYWLEAAAQQIFSGRGERHVAWPYRIPSLIAAVSAVTLTAYLGASLFGGVAGLLAAALLAVSTLLTAEGRMATIDTVLLLDILLVETALLRAYMDDRQGRDTPVGFAWLYWGALGCGLMLKGPVVLIPGIATPLALRVIERQARWFSRLRPRWGWLVTLAVVAPWCIAIGVVSHGTFFSRAVGTNFLGKIGHGQQAHGLPPGFHVGVFLLAFWPGSLFFVLGLPAIWARHREPAIRFLLCWIVPHWLVFEAIATKLPHYVLPTYPAIALLTAASLVCWPLRRPAAGWARGLLGLYAVLWSVLSLAFAVAGTVLLWKSEHRIEPASLIASLGALPLILGALWLLYRAQRLRAAWMAIASAVIIHAGIFLTVIPNLGLLQLAPRAASLFDDYRPCNESILVSVSYSEPSLAFLTGSNTRFLGVRDAAEFLSRHDACALVLVDRKDLPALTTAMTAQGYDLTEYGRVNGLNYSNGHHLDLGLYAPMKR
ncbi:ArnT family glycosyltransferase [Swaminathania salitolerans]|uniref:Glycosyl transferase n=1 Tax=Swaminathania salitolerans TaxID=182838 RepID=A0A511BWE8_9PROT|nr:glycosyltransferase family 39 protein [Swaminathania salitolerans]GBQ13512.1 glycosyltransferase [Swaminathania salitolerans LMG 21291]GEL02328.1 glycosyl transferase [Swaminathania salitolerans]